MLLFSLALWVDDPIEAKLTPIVAWANCLESEAKSLSKVAEPIPVLVDVVMVRCSEQEQAHIADIASRMRAAQSNELRVIEEHFHWKGRETAAYWLVTHKHDLP